jgi:hypothetical protein
MNLQNDKNSQNKEKSPKTKFQLREWQKWLAAISSSLLILILILGTIQWFSNPSFRNFLTNVPKKGPVAAFVENDNDLAAQKALINLNEKLAKLNSGQDLYQVVKLADLPIYPDSWVARNFLPEEKNNTLLSGAIADFDRDGLSNKQEYFLGSNPKVKDTLCENRKDNLPVNKSSKIICDGFGSDKIYVDKGISPLTGFDLETPQQFKILKQDLAIVQGVKTSFETASSEGVDFPILYQLSKNIDLTRETDQIETKTTTDTPENIINYRQTRLDILTQSLGENQFSSLSQVYQTNKIEQLEIIKEQYEKQLDKLKIATVPQKMVQTHKTYILITQKLQNLIEFRIQGIKDKKLSDPEFSKTAKQKATEVVWGYRILSEIGAKDQLSE